MNNITCLSDLNGKGKLGNNYTLPFILLNTDELYQKNVFTVTDLTAHENPNILRNISRTSFALGSYEFYPGQTFALTILPGARHLFDAFVNDYKRNSGKHFHYLVLERDWFHNDGGIETENGIFKNQMIFLLFNFKYCFGKYGFEGIVNNIKFITPDTVPLYLQQTKPLFNRILNHCGEKWVMDKQNVFREYFASWLRGNSTTAKRKLPKQLGNIQEAKRRTRSMGTHEANLSLEEDRSDSWVHREDTAFSSVDDMGTNDLRDQKLNHNNMKDNLFSKTQANFFLPSHQVKQESDYSRYHEMMKQQPQPENYEDDEGEDDMFQSSQALYDRQGKLSTRNTNQSSARSVSFLLRSTDGDNLTQVRISAYLLSVDTGDDITANSLYQDCLQKHGYDSQEKNIMISYNGKQNIFLGFRLVMCDTNLPASEYLNVYFNEEQQMIKFFGYDTKEEAVSKKKKISNKLFSMEKHQRISNKPKLQFKVTRRTYENKFGFKKVCWRYDDDKTLDDLLEQTE